MNPATPTLHWLCPDLRPHWQLGRSTIAAQSAVVLQSRTGATHYWFSPIEGVALQYFTGTLTVQQVGDRLRQSLTGESSAEMAADFVAQLLQTLIGLGVLAVPPEAGLPQPLTACTLKPEVEWIAHPEGYWILRNPIDVTFLQVSAADKALIDKLQHLNPAELCQRCNLPTATVQTLLQLLQATAMLLQDQPSSPQPARRPPRKWTPLKLLSFKRRLFNPDRWLTQQIDHLRWIWSLPFGILLGMLLLLSLGVSHRQSGEILYFGQQLWQSQGEFLLLPFLLLLVLVTSLHELGHAFTLKYYGGIVPEVGLLVTCLMPGAYVNTSDAYCLVKRRQRAWVVAAGVAMQWILWAIGLWAWLLSAEDSWLHTSGYGLMVAALFSVAVNLNPLSKFDGYYLMVALTGINNLRGRSFGFYTHLLRGQSTAESRRDAVFLLLYAPLSLIYTLLIFGRLLLWLLEWLWTHVPAIALLLFCLWLIYYCLPTRSQTTQLQVTQPQAAQT